MSVSVQLAVVRIIFQVKLPTNLPDGVASIISNFLIPDVSLASAIKSGPFGSVALLNLMWARSLQDAKSDQWSVTRLLQCEPHYYRWEFSQALLQAVRRGDRGMVEWLEIHFPSCPVTCSVVEAVASRGWLWLLQLLLPGRGKRDIRGSSKALDNAASNGHWDVVHWLVENTSGTTFRGTSLLTISVRTNNLEELTWLLGKTKEIYDILPRNEYDWISKIPECTEEEWPTRKKIFVCLMRRFALAAASALNQAAQHDDIRFAKEVFGRYFIARHNNAQRALRYSAQTASKHGRVAILRWLLKSLHAHGICDDLSDVMFAAAENGQVEVVKWLCEKYTEKSSVYLFLKKEFKQPNGCAFAMDVAASQGHLEVFQVLQNAKLGQRQQPQCTHRAMDAAASAGHLDVVKWLHFNRSEGCTKDAMDAAAYNGHLEVVKWLSQNRSEGCSSWSLSMVASRSSQESNDMASNEFYKKQLEIIQWMYRSSGSGTSIGMDGAAASGNLEMLKWLHENTNAGFTSKAMGMAAAIGQSNPLARFGYGKYNTAMDNAAGNGHLDIVKWLHVNRSEGCTPAAMDRAAANGHLDVLKWLHDNRSEGCTADATDNAAASGDFKMVKWLLANRSESVAFTALVKAAKNGHLRLVRYLAPHCAPRELELGVREALNNERFEVVLFLYSLSLNCGDGVGIQSVLSRAALHFQGDIELRHWIDEKTK